MRKGIEFSFAWLFSVIAGAVIIFLAIYIGVKMVGTSEYQASTVTAEELSIIFEPLETGLASAKATQATLSTETKIFNDCYTSGFFGRQEISLATKKGQGWSNPGGKITIGNKYIFSDVAEGKKIYIFGMPFSFPFKVADIIVLSTKEYCFVNAPDFVREDLGNLKLGNVKFDTNCSAGSLKVCFGSGNRCNMIVNSLGEDGFVVKGTDKMYYTGNLLYAAIFSSPELYSCNVKRLMEKAGQLALLYRDESNMLIGKCSSVAGSELGGFASQLLGINDTSQLLGLKGLADSLADENSFAECSLW